MKSTAPLCFTVLLIAGLGVLSSPEVSTAGPALSHDLRTPVACTTPGAEKCYASRAQLFLDPEVHIDTVAFDVSLTNPCIVQGMVHHPVWVHMGFSGVGAGLPPVFEAGVWKHAEGAAEVYVCCINCEDILEPERPQCVGVPWALSTGSAHIQMRYFPIDDAWRWFVNNDPVYEVIDESLDYPKAVSVGAEVDYWPNDVGVHVHGNINAWRVGYGWQKFAPNDRGGLVVSHPSGRWITLLRLGDHSTSEGSDVIELNDHWIGYGNDACSD